MDLQSRARLHAALGDPSRLRLVDALLLGDHTFQELAEAAGLPGNLAAHHLAVLESAGLIERRTSDGDHRRRYVRLRHDRLDELAATVAPVQAASRVLFVCTHNSARSQFAAALWQRRTSLPGESAGTEPAATVHPGAVRAAAELGVDLAGRVPRGYDAVTVEPDLVVSVCDRARESGVPFDAPVVHWSIPDPVRAGTPDAFRHAFTDIAERIERLAAAERS